MKSDWLFLVLYSLCMSLLIGAFAYSLGHSAGVDSEWHKQQEWWDKASIQEVIDTWQHCHPYSARIESV